MVSKQNFHIKYIICLALFIFCAFGCEEDNEPLDDINLKFEFAMAPSVPMQTEISNIELIVSSPELK